MISSLPTRQRTAYLMRAVTLLLLLIFAAPLWAQEAQERDSLIVKIDLGELKKFVSVTPMAILVNEHGTSLLFTKRPGLTGTLSIGVYRSSADALGAWQSLPSPKDSSEKVTAVLGQNARVWQVEENLLQIHYRKENVVIQFDWQGTVEEAVNYAKKLDGALQQDGKLAVHGPVVAVPETDVIAPAIVPLNQSFPLLFRTPRSVLLSVAPNADDVAAGQDNPVPMAIEGAARLSPEERMSAVLKTAGKHQLRLTFVTAGSVVFQKSLSVYVLTEQESLQQQKIKGWDLPDKTIYLSPQPDDKSGTIAQSKVEPIGLNQGLEPLKPEPALSREFWELRAWNELSGVLNTEWLPPRDLIKMFVNATNPTIEYVAWVAYKRDNYQIMIQSEVGKQIWIYLEQPDNLLQQAESPLLPKGLIASDLARPIIYGDGEITFPRSSWTVRSIRGNRSLIHEGPSQPVRVFLIHFHQPGQVHLNFPTYN